MLRLHHDGVSAREIGRTLGLARSTIQDNLKRAEKAGIGWPLAPELTDGILEDRLFAKAGFKPGQRRRTEPDWVALARELKRPGVNLMILWEDYRDAHPEGYGYSRFCDLFREFERRLTPVMRQHHAAGDKVFVDYLGKRVPIADPATGEVHMAEIFVGVLGASNYTYAETTFTQQLPDWIGAHVRMFRFFRGLPRLVVPQPLTTPSASIAGRQRSSLFKRRLSGMSGFPANSKFLIIAPPIFARNVGIVRDRKRRHFKTGGLIYPEDSGGRNVTLSFSKSAPVDLDQTHSSIRD